MADLATGICFPYIQQEFKILKSSFNRPEEGKGGEQLGKVIPPVLPTYGVQALMDSLVRIEEKH